MYVYSSTYSDFPQRWSQIDQPGCNEISVHPCSHEYRMVEESFMSTFNSTNIRIIEVWKWCLAPPTFPLTPLNTQSQIFLLVMIFSLRCVDFIQWFWQNKMTTLSEACFGATPHYIASHMFLKFPCFIPLAFLNVPLRWMGRVVYMPII